MPKANPFVLDKKSVYCASPYNSGPLSLVDNITNAQTLAKTAHFNNFVPVSPVENFRHLDGEVDERKILELCIELLLSCDALYLAPTWEGSTGARIERRVAKAARMPILSITYEEIEEAGFKWITEPEKF